MARLVKRTQPRLAAFTVRWNTRQLEDLIAVTEAAKQQFPLLLTKKKTFMSDAENAFAFSSSGP